MGLGAPYLVALGWDKTRGLRSSARASRLALARAASSSLESSLPSRYYQAAHAYSRTSRMLSAAAIQRSHADAFER